MDNGIDQMKIYRINSRTKRLELVDILRCKRESGPKLIKFSPDGRFAYLNFELNNTIEVYKYDGTGKSPVFEKIQTVSTLASKDDQIHDATSGLCFSPDGKYLFCSTAGEDTVAMYKRDEETVFWRHNLSFRSAEITPRIWMYFRMKTSGSGKP